MRSRGQDENILRSLASVLNRDPRSLDHQRSFWRLLVPCVMLADDFPESAANVSRVATTSVAGACILPSFSACEIKARGFKCVWTYDYMDLYIHGWMDVWTHANVHVVSFRKQSRKQFRTREHQPLRRAFHVVSKNDKGPAALRVPRENRDMRFLNVSLRKK